MKVRLRMAGGRESLSVEERHGVLGGRRKRRGRKKPSSLLTKIDPGWGGLLSFPHLFPLCLPEDVHWALCSSYDTPTAGVS